MLSCVINYKGFTYRDIAFNRIQNNLIASFELVRHSLFVKTYNMLFFKYIYFWLFVLFYDLYAYIKI